MTNDTRVIFSGMQILFEGKWVKQQAVIVEGKRIKAIIPEEMIKHHLPAKRAEFPADYYLAPGFIDLHVHGAAGVDVMDASCDALHTMQMTLAKEGVTGFLATTMTAAHEKIEAVLKTIPAAMQSPLGAAVLGVHLEGPFIAKERMGAQNPLDIIPPNIDLIKHWQHVSNHAIKMVTLAPELKGALEFIELLNRDRVVVSIGHTNATYAQTCDAITAGCTHATHLFNAMRGIHQREPGPVTALLLADNVTAEIIVDGLHLHPAIVNMVLRLKGRERLMLVTDAMRAKCMGAGMYDLGGQAVVVESGKATLKDGTLAGSTLTMIEAIKNMQSFTHLPLAECILMASYNPARLLGITEHKGTIVVGKDADLVLLDPSLNVKLTMREGAYIAESE